MQDNPQALHVRLVWHDVATGEGKEYTGPLPVRLGRAADNTIVLNSSQISRYHALLVAGSGGGVVLQDNQSMNGTFVDRERITSKALDSGTRFQMGPFHLVMAIVPALSQQSATRLRGLDELETLIMSREQTTVNVPIGALDAESSLVFSRLTGQLAPFASPEPEEALPVVSFHQQIISVQELRSRQVPIRETTYLAVGAGLGSFTWVDHLRICGVPAEQIIALGPEPRPNARYERLCRNSQIPAHERLRSHSDSCPDNIWGWPTYGLREVWGSLRTGQIMHALKVAGWVLGEPVISYTFTPRSGDVFKALDREARRIGWDRIWQAGWAQTVRKTDDGRYVVAYVQPNEQGKPIQQFVIGRYLHLAMGYPGIRTLPDVQAYRLRTNDILHTVNAYEEHNHIYEHLLKHGGVVMVRGRGIVASRVIQRLYETRLRNPSVVIVHLHRSPVVEGHRDRRAQRRVKNYTELQPFNWPKGCWGGSMLFELERADDQERDRLINDWAGTTTADRTDWQRLAQKGVLEGWYQNYFGEVKSIAQTEQGQLLTHISTGKPNQPELSLAINFMIDCTGAEAALDFNPLLKDMIDCYQLKRNPKERLRVTNDFEVIGMQNGSGHVYASGIMTLGGPHAAADSFLGLQYAGLRAVEALTMLQAPGLHRLTPLRSFAQWVRWTQGVQP